jgi:hypothetical protein
MRNLATGSKLWPPHHTSSRRSGCDPLSQADWHVAAWNRAGLKPCLYLEREYVAQAKLPGIITCMRTYSVPGFHRKPCLRGTVQCGQTPEMLDPSNRQFKTSRGRARQAFWAWAITAPLFSRRDSFAPCSLTLVRMASVTAGSMDGRPRGATASCGPHCLPVGWE